MSDIFFKICRDSFFYMLNVFVCIRFGNVLQHFFKTSSLDCLAKAWSLNFFLNLLNHLLLLLSINREGLLGGTLNAIYSIGNAVSSLIHTRFEASEIILDLWYYKFLLFFHSTQHLSRLFLSNLLQKIDDLSPLFHRNLSLIHILIIPSLYGIVSEFEHISHRINSMFLIHRFIVIAMLFIALLTQKLFTI